MNLRADLHVHSTSSDGRLSPSEVVARAANSGLSVLALTDHDSAEGVQEALETARCHASLLVLPGVEINTDVPEAEVHILGYCMDYRHPAFVKELLSLREGRLERGARMVDRLDDIGIKLRWDRVRELAGEGAVGRPHVAQAMLEAGYVETLAEAFDKYIGRNCTAYVEREKVTPEKAVKLIVGAGGFAIMAHPHSFGAKRTEDIIGPLISAGLAGLEAYYNGYKPCDVGWIVSMAKAMGLLLSGGSDFHGLGGDRETPLGDTEIPGECVEAFVGRAREHRPDLFGEWTLAGAR